MLRALAPGILVLALLIWCSAAVDEYPRCNCEEDGFWSIESILECQRVSDFFIAVAYFSIPIELLYFVSCSNVPFKWVLFQFIAFIVLCGMTHLLNGWTYGPHAFQLTVALTTFKFLTALVSCATAITLITLIPLLLKVKVREFMLKKKTWDLGREVGIIKRQSEAGWHVRMLTREIRKSLDRHTILHTTMVELSNTLDLQNCAVWMPNENRTEVILTHELRGMNFPNFSHRRLPYAEPDVRRIKESNEVQLLRTDSALANASSLGEHGAVAAIRMPMLRVSNFKGGTPELIQACYALLVLVLPRGNRRWTTQEVEIIKVVADQVAVAISHAAVLEESQLMREQLAEQNRALQQAQRDALMASQARNSFQRVMSYGMRRPMHSVLGLLSVLKYENLNSEQQLLVDTLLKTGNVLSLLIKDVTDDSPKESGRFPSEISSLGLHALVKEAGCFAKCLCTHKGFGFNIEVDRSLPNLVVGDEKRAFQVILHMVGNLVGNNAGGGGGSLALRVYPQRGSQGRNDQGWATWRSDSSDGYIDVRFEIEVMINPPFSDDSALTSNYTAQRCNNNEIVDKDLSFSICQKLVQLMQGNIWVVPNPQGYPESMALVLRFQLLPSIGIDISESGESAESRNSTFKGIHVLLADGDDMNRAVSKRLLEKLGCSVTPVSCGFECLTALGHVGSSFQILLLDLHMHDLDGFEVASQICKIRSRNLPLIVAMTANDDANFWEKFKKVGMNGVIRKPVLLQEMIDELHRVWLQA